MDDKLYFREKMRKAARSILNNNSFENYKTNYTQNMIKNMMIDEIKNKENGDTNERCNRIFKNHT